MLVENIPSATLEVSIGTVFLTIVLTFFLASCWHSILPFYLTCYSGILYRIWHQFCHSIWHSILAFYLAFYLFDMLLWHSILYLASILLFYLTLYSGILFGVLYCIWHLFWHSILPFYLTCYCGILYCIWHQFCHSIWHSILAFYLAFYTVYGIYSDILFCHSIWHSFLALYRAFYLAFILTFSLTWTLPDLSAHWDLEPAVEIQQCSLTFGARGWCPAVPTAIRSSQDPRLPEEKEEDGEGGSDWSDSDKI